MQVADKDKKIVTALHVRGAGTRGPPGSSTSVAVRLEFGTLPGGNDTWRLSTAVRCRRRPAEARLAPWAAAEARLRLAGAVGGLCGRQRTPQGLLMLLGQ